MLCIVGAFFVVEAEACFGVCFCLILQVTAVDRSFDSGLIQPGKTYRHTFTKAGTFNLFCTPHPFMKGTIVVKD